MCQGPTGCRDNTCQIAQAGAESKASTYVADFTPAFIGVDFRMKPGGFIYPLCRQLHPLLVAMATSHAG